MRPDEHKWKKSAEYKRKHGITEENKRCKKGNAHKVSLNSAKNPVQCDNSDDNQDSRNSYATKFSRRKLSSNWEKYESQTEEDPYIGPLQKGENFEKLLRCAGASAAQFRFKDEVFWEEDDSNPQCEQTTIDMVALADSLDCLTLCQKLNLGKEHFTVDQLKVIENQAIQNSTAGSTEHIRQTQLERDHIGYTKESCNDHSDACINGKAQTKSNSTCKDTYNGSSTIVASNMKTEFQHTSADDLDLDALLSIERIEKTPSNKHLDATGDDLEDWLDSILDKE
ncbi:uncharacterized protein LOC125652345 isoform X2 [Ostrea edulis]|uniref:uncharacterized protein LOC125652345 isoform X2 n=1 Tax=Ostrea edulis TaxID=37623 RepID=UPI0020965B77|nr:uncharacterized protein LOC125652345 isoform X2 [Ostrea edulis]XP_048737448.1 uncharacterized protein LOC125652345 isoform X2 [Ostrea edulis]